MEFCHLLGDFLIQLLELLITPLKAVGVCARFLGRSPGTAVVRITRKGVAHKSFARASYLGRPSPLGVENSYHAAGAVACTCLVHLHGINR